MTIRILPKQTQLQQSFLIAETSPHSRPRPCRERWQQRGMPRTGATGGGSTCCCWAPLGSWGGWWVKRSPPITRQAGWLVASKAAGLAAGQAWQLVGPCSHGHWPKPCACSPAACSRPLSAALQLPSPHCRCRCPRTLQKQVRWALAGRDLGRLEQIRSELAKLNPDCQACALSV